ncbi:MAG: hypothetical protein WA966_12665 [Ornithinimicrobium sp.]
MSSVEPSGIPRPVSAEAEISAEVERVVRRWRQLPLDHALRASPHVTAQAQQLADEVAGHRGVPLQRLPDLGPAVLMDQLRVVVYDYRTEGLDAVDLAQRLRELRRSLP